VKRTSLLVAVFLLLGSLAASCAASAGEEDGSAVADPVVGGKGSVNKSAPSDSKDARSGAPDQASKGSNAETPIDTPADAPFAPETPINTPIDAPIDDKGPGPDIPIDTPTTPIDTPAGEPTEPETPLSRRTTNS
jgi:hypothetical protein